MATALERLLASEQPETEKPKPQKSDLVFKPIKPKELAAAEKAARLIWDGLQKIIAEYGPTQQTIKVLAAKMAVQHAAEILAKLQTHEWQHKKGGKS